MLFLCMSVALAQAIQGTVSDASGMQIPGVNVTQKGTTNGVVTDASGHYQISVSEPKAMLVFSFVGYKTKEVQVGNNGQLDVQLEENNAMLDEVMVIGYGEQKKVNVIGSISQISNKEIANRPVTQLSQAITGQMPGVTVIQRSGQPGVGQGEIRVRGVGSFGASPNALVLIDGIPGTLNEVNPYDIKSISVLKDASSAAIYGARSANGVILITTNSGAEEKLKINYTGYVGTNTPTFLPKYANSWEYAELYNEANGTNSFTQEEIDKYKSQSDPDNYPNTQFLEDLMAKNGFQQGHNLTLNGGNQKQKYFISGGYLNQNGIIPKNNYDRYNLRANLINELGKQFTLTTRLYGSIENRNEPQVTANKGSRSSTGDRSSFVPNNSTMLNQLVQNAVRYPAIFLGQASNGDFGIGPESGGTPVAWINSDSYLTNNTTKAGVNMKLDYKPLKGLTLSAIGGYNFGFDNMKSFLASQKLNNNVSNAQSFLEQISNKFIYRTAQFTANYNRNIGVSNLDVLLGYAFENQKNDYFSGYRQNFASNDYTVIDLGSADNQQVNGFNEEWAIESVFGRVQYSWNERYLLESTVRYDGSSRFPKSQKYAIFPSAALGWRISEEEFLRDVKFLSNLKLKASWGILGNQNIGNYPYQTVLESGRNYSIGGGLATGAAYSTYRDAGIKWESTETKDIGFESSFFSGRLTFNTTYFDRTTRDILFKPSASVSSVLGVSISETNTGKAQNTGWEFELGYRGSARDFHYGITANMSIINNKVLTLGLGNANQPNGFVGNGSDLFIGYPMQMYYGYKTDGVFLSNDEVKDWADQSAVNPTSQTGDIRYVDISGPDGVPDGKVDANYDRTYLGSRIPHYTYGANLNASFKGFDLSVLLQGVAGVKGMLNSYAGYAFYNLGNIQRWMMDGRFDPNDPTRYPSYPRLEVLTNSGSGNTLLSDFWVLNASYMRVKKLQLGYSFPEAWTKSIKADKIRLYTSIENLLTIKKFRPGWDPETVTGGAYYPLLRTYTVGVNLSF
ncbi:TonB-dependent receptor [Marinilongibacter aquaticus]|uniref:SusC/RagA family TonB-linked outer membrane protein n=1 Tax=Marinilongibacter aquaticus TaxID=2975157 RepID=UPI0021BD37C0|nr:TonB-dependent receptor [Marinilongibacter aquaticus]UBM57472.1 TonB-dependent receptor [Marinilongibacter aquaticus]